VIYIKTDAEIAKMKKAGAIVFEALKASEKVTKPGVTTAYIDEVVRDCILSKGAKASFLNYNGYPASSCVSVNNEVVHGIPGKRVLKEGDIVSVDVGAYIDGFHADAARTFPVGEIDEASKKLIEVTKQSFFEGLRYARQGNRLYDISSAIQQYAESFGYSIVRELTGHGIGRDMHEDPSIPNYGVAGKGIRLKKGMALAIEPMINAGRKEVYMLNDGWTIVTADGKNSAHYENSIAITDGDPILLTVG